MEEFLAGAAAGVSGLLIGHPMEVMKVQLQVSKVAGGGSMRGAAAAMMSRGLSQGVFRGLAMPLASFTAINSIFFGVYGRALSGLESLRPDCHYGNVMLAGMAGGAAQLPLVVPVEMVKTAMQAQLARGATMNSSASSEFYRGPLHCATSIARRHGLRGLNRGFGITCARDVPSYGMYMLLYDWLAHRLAGHVTGDTAATLLAGGLAGSLSWLSVLPIDNVKSNLQADTEAPNSERRSVASVARQLHREHGVRGFFRGGVVVAARSFPVNAVTFFVWQRSLHLLRGGHRS